MFGIYLGREPAPCAGVSTNRVLVGERLLGGPCRRFCGDISMNKLCHVPSAASK